MDFVLFPDPINLCNVLPLRLAATHLPSPSDFSPQIHFVSIFKYMAFKRSSSALITETAGYRQVNSVVRLLTFSRSLLATIIIWKYVDTSLGTSRKTRRQRQRKRHQTKGLRSKTIAVHVNHNG